LGAGKTTWVRGFLAACGVTGAIQSPSYGLLASYVAQGWTYEHLDCYRLSVADDITALALDEYDRAQHLWLVEWPERAAARLPRPDLALALELLPGAHQIAVRAGTPFGQKWLSSI
jgi:tRNA threonylcarbamoyladenosine biosynthesis protein TsaE